ncbi:hypothetical protein VTN77DRAFT_730 [Rasamsonia byssochlamydoides]|uniref:uncharacterized protein n=1 Tax=Rasamsonia byssochlamydoides TaxID=89139 RepID=UPI0037445A05
MAPVTRSVGSSQGAEMSSFTNASHPSSQREPEVIEIDDDDDEDEDEEINDAESDDGEEDEDGEDDDDEEEEESSEDVNGTDSVMEDTGVESAESDHDAQTTPALFTSSGIQQALHPLRRTADRVTRQMEAFAEKLDRFKQQEHRPGDMGSFQAAYSLVKGYQRVGEDAIQEISRQNTLRRAKMGWNSGRENGTDPQGATKTEEELKRLQLEVDTWEILLNLIAVDDPSSRAHAKQSQESAFQNLHRYSSDREIWEQFLDADHYAMECVIVMKWLEHTARSSSQELDSLIAELEAQAERGQGLWAHGWLYTKETIKGQKRLRSWPQPLEPNDPGITLSLLSSEKQEPLITQLDPDAVIRQKQGLQKQDQFYERATWLTCWKMLRQGESWTKIREWSQERLESWRAVSLCGSSVDEQSSVGKTPVDDSMTRMMNCRSQDTWRAACSALARNPNTEDFEKAVYALLCGETEPAYKVCQSWDDYLYVFYNHTLLSRYRQFCTQFSRKLNHSPTANVPFVPEPPSYSEVHKFLQNVKSNERIGVEARNPYRTIQAAILSKNYDSFFLSIANAASQVGKTSGKPHLIPDIGATHVEDSALIAAQDRDALRIIAHLYIIARSLGYSRSDSHFSETAALNVIAYIEILQQAELLDFIPLYASILPAQLSQDALARILIDVVDPRERKKQAKLMEKHKIDLKAVLERQWHWVHSDAIKKQKRDSTVRLSRVVRDVRKDPKVLPVRKKFVGASVSPEDERMIRCVEWHKYLDGQWGVICELGTFLYKQFFATGSLIACRELSKRVRLSETSRQVLGFDITEVPFLEENGLENNVSEPASPTKSPSKKSRLRQLNGTQSQNSRVEMYQQAQIMLELEQLILAFDALENFQLIWDQHERSKGSQDAEHLRELKEKLQEALDHAAEYIESLFDGVLTDARDETEAEELEFIRHTYLPEVFLNYHSALYYGSLKLSRDILVQCMNLSILISRDQSVIDSFIASKRMGELVDALALSSAAMVNTPPTKGKKKFDYGGRLDIWNIKVEDRDEKSNNNT